MKQTKTPRQRAEETRDRAKRRYDRAMKQQPTGSGTVTTSVGGGAS